MMNHPAIHTSTGSTKEIASTVETPWDPIVTYRSSADWPTRPKLAVRVISANYVKNNQSKIDLHRLQSLTLYAILAASPVKLPSAKKRRTP